MYLRVEATIKNKIFACIPNLFQNIQIKMEKKLYQPTKDESIMKIESTRSWTFNLIINPKICLCVVSVFSQELLGLCQ